MNKVNKQKAKREAKNRKVINLSLPDKKALQYVIDGHRAYNFIKTRQGQSVIGFADYLFFALMQNSEIVIKMANEIAQKEREQIEKRNNEQPSLPATEGIVSEQVGE